LEEPAATTSAPIQDEAIQAILGMNQKNIQFKMRPFKPFWG
jgi:hypothetical protein